MSPIRRFKFSLETVLKVRSLREEQARLELAQALVRLEKSRAAMAEAQRHLAKGVAEFQGAPGRMWPAQDYQLLRGYLEHLKTAIQGWREQIVRQETEVREKQLNLERLHQERRLLARLRERKYWEFRREAAKFWEKETEAMVLSRWGRFEAWKSATKQQKPT